MSILSVAKVSKQYGDYCALDEVSITVPEQSVYGLLGPNGAGKTTLIRIINQIIGADKGSIYFNGRPMERKHIINIGYLPEERGLYRKMKVGEHLMYLAELKGMERPIIRKELDYWHERLGTGGWQNKKIEELSKGMQQKIQFIATVIHKPKLLILDEPFTGFDPINSKIIRDELERLRQQGTTIILSTHRMESVEEMCTHMALINLSKKIKEGTIRDVRKSYHSENYTVHYTGNLPEDYEAHTFNILRSWKSNEDMNAAELKLVPGKGPNDMLRELISFVEVHNFKEEMPSINDIFISLVKGNVNLDEENLVDHTA